VHTLENLSLVVYLIIDYIQYYRDNTIKEARKSKFLINTSGESFGSPQLSHHVEKKQSFLTWKFVVGVSLALILVLANGIMRFRAGINTLNQVVFGWYMGIWLAFVFGFILRAPIFNHIKALVADEDDDMKWYGIMPALGAVTFLAMASFIVVGVLSHEYPEYFTNPFLEQMEIKK